MGGVPYVKPFRTIGVLTFILLSAMAILPLEAILLSTQLWLLRTQSAVHPSMPYVLRTVRIVDIPTTVLRLCVTLLVIPFQARWVECNWRGVRSRWKGWVVPFLGLAIVAIGMVELIFTTIVQNKLGQAFCVGQLDIVTSAIALESLGHTPALQSLHRFGFPIEGVVPRPGVTPEQEMLCIVARRHARVGFASFLLPVTWVLFWPLDGWLLQRFYWPSFLRWHEKRMRLAAAYVGEGDLECRCEEEARGRGLPVGWTA